MRLFTLTKSLVATGLLVDLPMTEGQHRQKRLRRLGNCIIPVGVGPPAVNLGAAINYVILSKAGVTTTGTTSIVGHIGTGPIAATALTGFGLILDISGTLSKSDPPSLVTGNIFAANYADPTPAMLTTAVLDMEAAYVDAAGRSNPASTELGAGNLNGVTLTGGLYKWSSGVTITTSVTFDGDPADTWILQIAGGFIVEGGARVELINGARAENIFWSIAEASTFAANSHVEGIFLCHTGITFADGSSMNGAALAQTSVTLSSATIVKC